MKTETQIIAIGLDVLALNIPDGSNCKLIKAASDKLIELESENEALKYLDDEASHGASELTNKIGEINALANGLWDWSNMLDDTNLERLRKIIKLSGGVVCRSCAGSQKFRDTNLECPDCKPDAPAEPANSKLTDAGTKTL